MGGKIDVTLISACQDCEILIPRLVCYNVCPNRNQGYQLYRQDRNKLRSICGQGYSRLTNMINLAQTADFCLDAFTMVKNRGKVKIEENTADGNWREIVW